MRRAVCQRQLSFLYIACQHAVLFIRPSVLLSVRPSNANIVSKRMDMSTHFLTLLEASF